MTKKILIVDGPRAGDWVQLGDAIQPGGTFRLPRPAQVALNIVSDAYYDEMEILTDTYYVHDAPFAFFGWKANFMLATSIGKDPWELGKAIVDALFHRDVAKEFRG